MNRAERRRQQKATKSNIPTPLNVSNYTVQQISKVTGTRVDSLMAWISAREQEMAEAYQKEAQEKLWKAEDYIAVANVMISIYAIKMSRKKGEHTKDLINRMLENLNPAREYIEKVGVEEAYRQAKQDFGIEIEFDSVDMNKEFGF